MELDNFAESVIAALTGNATYPTPPVTLANLQTAKNDLSAKIAAQTGGSFDTAAENNSRQSLLGMMRQTASYLQMQCNDDLPLLLSSGFQAQSTNRASVPLDQPENLALKNGASGELAVRVTAARNVNMYEGRIKLDDGDWLPSVFSGDSKHITFTGLTPAKNYTAQVRPSADPPGQSDWSDPSSHMAM